MLDTVRRAAWGKIKNGSFASDLRSVHISRYAIKIPGEIVWYGHYGSSSAFKRYNMRCSFEIFLRLHKTVIFCVEEIILGIETTRYVSTLRSYMWLKCLILNVSFSLVLFSPQIFSRYIDMCMKDTDLLIENNVQPILVFQKKLESKANVESSSANLLLLRTTAS